MADQETIVSTTDVDQSEHVEPPSAEYTPVFDAHTRKIAYLVSGLIGTLGAAATLVSAVPGTPVWLTVAGGVCALVGSSVAGMFGVHYAGVSR